MKLRFLFILAITQFMAVSAQLKEFSLDNLMPGGKTYARFVPKNIKQLQFLGENYIYQKGDSIMIVKPGNHKEKVLVTVKDINRFIAEKGLKPVGSMPRISGGKTEKKTEYRFYMTSILSIYLPTAALSNSFIHWKKETPISTLTRTNANMP